jgi:hypothetical protein
LVARQTLGVWTEILGPWRWSIHETFKLVIVVQVVSLEEHPCDNARVAARCVALEHTQLLQRSIAGYTEVGDRSVQPSGQLRGSGLFI